MLLRRAQHTSARGKVGEGVCTALVLRPSRFRGEQLLSSHGAGPLTRRRERSDVIAPNRQ